MQNEKIERSLEIIRLAAKMSRQYYDAPLIVTYSGGKDSDALADLAVKSGAEVEFEHSLTTVDAPETVHHVQATFKRLSEAGYKVTIIRPSISMWRLIEKKGSPPTRMARYCCKEFKETTTPNRYIATGVRSAESTARRDQLEFNVRGRTKKEGKRYSLEHVEEVYEEAQENLPDSWDCQFIIAAKEHQDLVCNPILDWSDTDIWEYIHTEQIEYNPLYDKGFTRVGCIGCPMGRYKQMMRQFADYPKYKDAYIRAFDRMLKIKEQKGLKTKWKTGQEVFDWWIQNPNIPSQLSFEDVLEGGAE